jgi:hypothetical protein
MQDLSLVHILLQLALGYAGWVLLKSYAADARASQGHAREKQALPKYVMHIPGTKTLMEIRRETLKQYGIPAALVRQVSVYDEPAVITSMPEQVQKCLAMCYNKGNTRGPEVAQVLKLGKPLKDGEALYFVLTEIGDEPDILAFVGDKPTVHTE